VIKVGENTLIVSCAIFRKELETIMQRNEWNFKLIFLEPLRHLGVKKLDRELNNNLERFSRDYDKKIVIYGKCLSNIDDICSKYGAKRIKGENCPEILLGERFLELIKEEPGTFYLTPPLCKDFKKMVIKCFFTDDYTKLKENYFRNYKRAVYIDTNIDDLSEKAREISERLDLRLITEKPGTRNLEKRLKEIL